MGKITLTWQQADLGFVVQSKQWFISFLKRNRWYSKQQMLSDKVKLENVLIDTYSYADQQQQDVSHGRFRIYNQDNKITGNYNGDEVKDTCIQGTKENKFKRYIGTPEIWYDIKNFEWKIKIDGVILTTKNIQGKFNGDLISNPINFVSNKKITVNHSFLTSLIDLEI